MSVIEQVTEPETSAPEYGVAPEGLRHRLFTVTEYEKMAEIGIIKPDERVELLDGEIVPMSPMRSAHLRALLLLQRVFGGMANDANYDVASQVPVRLSARDLPEPDFILLRRVNEQRDLGPKDVLLVIEVSDSTLLMDKGKKLQMYATAGISEYWILNIGESRLEVYRSPDVKAGIYKDITIHDRGSVISPMAVPSVEVSVEKILPA